MTPADLIRDGHCTAACVAAVTTGRRCACPCAGEYHGLLAAADVTVLIEGRRFGLHRLTDIEVVARDCRD